MEESRERPGERLMQAFHEVRRNSTGFRPIAYLRTSELYMLHAIYAGLRRQLQEMKERGLVPPPGVTVSSLSRATHNSMPAVSQILSGLEEKNIVERVPAKADRRKVYIRLTKHGEETVEEVGRTFFRFLDQVAERMGEEDLEELIRLLHKASGVLQEIKNELRQNACPDDQCNQLQKG